MGDWCNPYYISMVTGKSEKFKHLCCGSSLHLDQGSSRDNRNIWQWSYAVRISDYTSGEKSNSPLFRMFGCQSLDGVRWDMNTPPLCWGSLHTGDCSLHYLANISLEQTRTSRVRTKIDSVWKAGDMKLCLLAYEIQGVNWNGEGLVWIEHLHKTRSVSLFTSKVSASLFDAIMQLHWPNQHHWPSVKKRSYESNYIIHVEDTMRIHRSELWPTSDAMQAKITHSR